MNCPRCIHRYQKVADLYLSAEEGEAPLPGWKQIGMVQEALYPKVDPKAPPSSKIFWPII